MIQVLKTRAKQEYKNAGAKYLRSLKNIFNDNMRIEKNVCKARHLSPKPAAKKTKNP